MQKKQIPPTPDAYIRLRTCSREQLWNVEIPRFKELPEKARQDEVGLVRAVGVVFSEHGTPEEKKRVRQWLVELLDDPSEKIRRYTVNALPKLESGPAEETALVGLYQRTTSEREKKFLRDALGKFGGRTTLETLGGQPEVTLERQIKLRANMAREEQPGGAVLDRPLTDIRSLRIHLRGRRGLEGFVRDEVESHPRTRDRFRVIEASKGLVALRPLAPFNLGDLYSLRCFGSVSFVTGLVKERETQPRLEGLARAIASPLTRRLFSTFHEGSPRYRLEFVDRKAEVQWVRDVASRAYTLNPEILNDSHQAPWAVDVHETKAGESVELRPRLSPDPRFAYRLHDVAAASHPPLAASLARWAGRTGKPERIWDPFCGSGLELIESGLLGNVAEIHGTDLSEEALAHARANFEAAGLKGIRNHFTCCDFRDYPKKGSIRPGSLSLVISNPPLGRRIRIPNLRGLMENLFRTADQVLARGGRLVFTNPIHMDCPVPGLKLDSRIIADLGGFDCRLEKWIKL